MSSTNLRTIQRRDAAVTAALAGGVLVILGYASGLGIKQSAATATVTPNPSPAAVAPVETPAPPQAVPAREAAAPAAVVVPAAPAASTPSAHPGPTHPPVALPSTPTEPAPAPPPAEPTCPPGLVTGAVSGLPVVPGVLSVVSDLLTTPLVGESEAAPGAPAPADDPMSCALGSLVGTTCCASSTAARVTGSPAP